MKKIMMLGLLVYATVLATGCTAGDVRSGSRGVGVGIGTGGDWYPGWPGPRDPEPGYPDYPNDPGYPDYPSDPTYPDYPNDPNPPTNPPHRPPRGEPTRPPGSHCDKWGCWDPTTTPNAVAGTWNADVMAKSSVASKLAKKYQIPMSASSKIAQSFANVNSQGMDAFYAMGLTENDMKGFMKRQIPSEASIKTASGKLGLSETQTRTLITSMMREFFKQANNVKSEYWQRCMSEGKWKTDRNQSCEKTFWPGCSPAEGAQFCY